MSDLAKSLRLERRGALGLALVVGPAPARVLERLRAVGAKARKDGAVELTRELGWEPEEDQTAERCRACGSRVPSGHACDCRWGEAVARGLTGELEEPLWCARCGVEHLGEHRCENRGPRARTERGRR